jgi:hypothetical protein
VVKANPPYLDLIRNMIRSTPVNGFVGCAAALADHDYADAVATVTPPMLFLVGEKDGVNPAAMRKLHEALPARVMWSSQAPATSPISLGPKGSTAPFVSSSPSRNCVSLEIVPIQKRHMVGHQRQVL